jgi:hypothetical protein
MAETSVWVWLVLGAVAFTLVTVVLHTLARSLQEERRVSELRDRVMELRAGYNLRLAELAGRGIDEVSPVGEDGPAETTRKAA